MPTQELRIWLGGLGLLLVLILVRLPSGNEQAKEVKAQFSKQISISIVNGESFRVKAEELLKKGWTIQHVVQAQSDDRICDYHIIAGK